MAQLLSPNEALHVHASRYAQRERPAASIPDRISARRLHGAPDAPVPQRHAASPAIALLLALRGPVV
ncbi:MAG: hypothetical protein ABI305_07450 [Tepidiformaceae bacterium]